MTLLKVRSKVENIVSGATPEFEPRKILGDTASSDVHKTEKYSGLRKVH
jgi:hypothetical protein